MHWLRKNASELTKKNFMDKEINQAVMVRSKLRSKILKLKTEKNRLVYAKQRNYCLKLLQLNSDSTLKT